MILIIGGAYQGKLSFAVEKYNLKKEEILDLEKNEFVSGYRCYTHFECLTKKWPEEDIQKLVTELGEAIVVCREISSGVVPIEKETRLYREKHGRMIKKIAQASEEVIRVYCGLATKIK